MEGESFWVAGRDSQRFSLWVLKAIVAEIIVPCALWLESSGSHVEQINKWYCT